MGFWQWLAIVVGLGLGALFLLGVLLFLRRHTISSLGGTFELSVRVGTRSFAHGWILGLGRYDAQDLQWFRIFTLWPKPARRWSRDELEFVSKREPTSSEALSLYPGTVIALCRAAGAEVELAMSPQALTGFQSWLEAAPPADPMLKR